MSFFSARCHSRFHLSSVLLALACFCSPAFAQITTTYSYDAQGRVTLSDATNDDASRYEYDDAGNITRAEATSLGSFTLNSAPDCDAFLYTSIDSTITVDGLTNCTDPDGDAMSVVSASAPGGGVTVSVSGNFVTFSGVQEYATAYSDVVVTDGQGNNATHTATVYREGGDGGFPPD